MSLKTALFSARRGALVAVLGAAPLGLAVADPAAPPATEIPAIGAAPATPPAGSMGQEGLNATAWVQSSTEARIAARQAYFGAIRQLEIALANPHWSAAVEQGAPFEKLAPAVILDLDETVLDNSPYQARLVRSDAPYSGQSWARWVAQADARAIPGAQKFLNFANRKGVGIFFVSNRGQAEEAATRENLRRLGVPVQKNGDHVLMSGERPDWTSDKTSRRRFVAKNHRVLLLIGDDMNDFVPAKPLTLRQRSDLMEKYASYWGERWILLSNPLYGSWEGALFDYQNGLSRGEMLARKYRALDTREAVATPAAEPATR